MKNAIMFVTAAMFVGTLAFGADVENKESTTVDHSKNPITGTKTTTKKYKGKVKDAHGQADVNVTEKTKTKTDGTVEKSVKVDSDSSDKH